KALLTEFRGFVADPDRFYACAAELGFGLERRLLAVRRPGYADRSRRAALHSGPARNLRWNGALRGASRPRPVGARTRRCRVRQRRVARPLHAEVAVPARPVAG